MMFRQSLTPRAHHSGFTLMEVLIAMAIGLVVLVGALSYFGRGVRALQTGDSYARMHEAASRAGSLLARDIQLAGFYGYGGSASENSITPSTGVDFSSAVFYPAHPNSADSAGNRIFNAGVFPDACNAASVMDLGRPIEYYDNDNAIATQGGIPVATCFPLKAVNDPVLILRGAMEGESFIPTSESDTNPLNVNTQILVTANPFSGAGQNNVAYFFGNAPGASVTSLTDYSLGRAFQAGLIPARRNGMQMPVFPYSYHAYYIRPCNDFDVATNTCRDAIAEPTLVRQQLVPGTGTGPSVGLEMVRMIPGIQSMRFFWGMDTRGSVIKSTDEIVGDGVTDYWVSTLTTPSQYSNVNTVRIQLLVRASAPDATYNDGENHYYFDGDTVGFTCTGEDCRYRRMIYETASSVRNCSLRRRSGTILNSSC